MAGSIPLVALNGLVRTAMRVRGEAREQSDCKERGGDDGSLHSRGPFIARTRTRVGRTAGVTGLVLAVVEAGLGLELVAVESVLAVMGLRLTPWVVRQPPPGG